MKKNLLAFIVAICSAFMATAQHETPPKRTCGTLEHYEYLKQTRPNYESDVKDYNKMIEEYLQVRASRMANSNGKANSASLTPTVIPVVVHVVYRTAVPASSISVAQAASQVQVLNDDFAKLNADASK